MATKKKNGPSKGKGPRLPTRDEKQKVIRTLDTILKENEELKLHVDQVKGILQDLDYIDI